MRTKRSLMVSMALLFAAAACTGGRVTHRDSGTHDPGGKDAATGADRRLDGSQNTDATSEDSGASNDAGDLGDASTADGGGDPGDGSTSMDGGSGSDASDPADAGSPDSGAPNPACVIATSSVTARGHYDALLGCLASTAQSSEKRSAIDGFMGSVLAGEGFPIVTGDQVVFVYVRDARYDTEDDQNVAEDYDPARRGSPIRVTGSFSAWAPNAHTLVDRGESFFSAEVTISSADRERGRYKLVARDGQSNDVWFSDPSSRRFDYDSNGRISIVRGGALEGHLELIRDVSTRSLGGTRSIYVYLPPGYEQGSGAYPVLYMHDGNNLFDWAQPNSAGDTWNVDDVIEVELAANRIRPLIVVGVPNSSARMDEYTHVPDDIGSGLVGGLGDDYADFLVNGVKPLIDQSYRTLPDRANTGVMGSSLGGLISFAIGLDHPQVFRFVGGMSSTFEWGRITLANPTMLELYAAATDLGTRDQIFYLDTGGGPAPGPCQPDGSGDDEDAYCEGLAMRDILVAHGIDQFPDDPDASPLTPANIDIYHYWQANAPHNESAWNARMFRPLRLFARP